MTQRPSWYCDIKWLIAIVFVPVFLATVVLANLSWLTAPERAVKILGTAMAAALDPKGLNDKTEIEQLKRILQTTKKDTFYPIPGLNIGIQKDDLINLSPKEARLNFFSKIAKPLYENGAQGLAALATNKEMKQQVLQGIGPLEFLSYKNHLLLKQIFFTLIVISVVLLGLLVVFSSRFGRLFNPGLAVLLSTGPIFILLLLANQFLNSTSQDARPDPSGGIGAMAGYITSMALADYLKILLGYHQKIVLAALGLIVLSILGKLGWRLLDWALKK